MVGNVVKSRFIRFDLHKRLLKQHKCFQFWTSFRVVVYSSAIHLVLGSLSKLQRQWQRVQLLCS